MAEKDQQSKQEQLRKEAVPVPVASPKARAAVCPLNPIHTSTRIYSVRGKVRYCACDTCGHTWKQIVSDGEASADFLVLLADSFEASPKQMIDKVESIVIPLIEVKKIVDRLRQLSVK